MCFGIPYLMVGYRFVSPFLQAHRLAFLARMGGNEQIRWNGDIAGIHFLGIQRQLSSNYHRTAERHNLLSPLPNITNRSIFMNAI